MISIFIYHPFVLVWFNSNSIWILISTINSRKKLPRLIVYPVFAIRFILNCWYVFQKLVLFIWPHLPSFGNVVTSILVQSQILPWYICRLRITTNLKQHGIAHANACSLFNKTKERAKQLCWIERNGTHSAPNIPKSEQSHCKIDKLNESQRKRIQWASNNSVYVCVFFLLH